MTDLDRALKDALVLGLENDATAEHILRIAAPFIDRAFQDQNNRIEKLEAAVGGAYSWIDRWAKHVPNCRAPMRPCTCGRDAVMYEASKALEGKDD